MSPNLSEFAFALLGLGAEEGDGRLALPRLLAAHARALHLPDFAAADLELEELSNGRRFSGSCDLPGRSWSSARCTRMTELVLARIQGTATRG